MGRGYEVDEPSRNSSTETSAETKPRIIACYPHMESWLGACLCITILRRHIVVAWATCCLDTSTAILAVSCLMMLLAVFLMRNASSVISSRRATLAACVPCSIHIWCASYVWTEYSVRDPRYVGFLCHQCQRQGDDLPEICVTHSLLAGYWEPKVGEMQVDGL